MLSQNTHVLLHMMERLLKQFLELAQRIDESDLKELSMKVKQNQKDTKSIKDALDLGNLFLLAFFCRQLMERLDDEPPTPMI
jgi:hypothetical protein